MSPSTLSRSIGSPRARSAYEPNDRSMSDVTIKIPRRFCGPPLSGNGGYTGGRLAEHVAIAEDAPAVAVRLFAPTPLERSLTVHGVDGRVELRDGDTLLARAHATSLDLEPPAPPDLDTATRAAKDFRGFHEHVFPGCFVCGPDRPEGDGLRIFPGPANAEGLFAAPWTPDESLRGEGDSLSIGIVWAALDCPGAFSFPQPEGRVLLLGKMKVRSLAPVEIGEACIVTSWYFEQDGRKHRTGSALHGEGGACRAYAQTLWIEVDPESVPRD